MVLCMIMHGIRVRIVVDRREIMDNMRSLIDLDDHYHLLQVWTRQRMNLVR